MASREDNKAGVQRREKNAEKEEARWEPERERERERESVCVCVFEVVCVRERETLTPAGLFLLGPPFLPSFLVPGPVFPGL